MKTQLLEDFDESGSAAQPAGPVRVATPPAGNASGKRAASPSDNPAANAAVRAPAAVWHRPQAPAQHAAAPAQSVQRGNAGAPGGMTGSARQGAAEAGQMRPPGGHSMQGGAGAHANPAGPNPAAPPQSRQRAPEGAWAGPRPLPPEARAAVLPADSPAPAPAPARTPADEPTLRPPPANAPAPEGAWPGSPPLAPQARATAAPRDAHARTRTLADAPAVTPARGQAQTSEPPGPAEQHQPAAPSPNPPSEAPDPASDIPDWLSQRLREDAEQEAQHQRSRLAMRRALGWSAAATLTAMVAVAGYWFYQESRVEGALDVVANTSPAPGPSAPGPSSASAVKPAAAPAMTAPAVLERSASSAAPGASANASAAAPAQAAASKAAADAPAVPDAVPPSRVAAAPGAAEPGKTPVAATPARAARSALPTRHTAARSAAALDNIDHPLRAGAPSSHHKQHIQSVPRIRSDDDTGSGQRRQETLLQCQVRGYDEQECKRRGCMMTRFGLACPG